LQQNAVGYQKGVESNKYFSRVLEISPVLFKKKSKKNSFSLSRN
jgi:hypothetical protein